MNAAIQQFETTPTLTENLVEMLLRGMKPATGDGYRIDLRNLAEFLRLPDRIWAALIAWLDIRGWHRAALSMAGNVTRESHENG